MADLTVYEIEASITLNFNFEVDASSRDSARVQAHQQLKQFLVGVKKEFDSSDISIDAVVESEGH